MEKQLIHSKISEVMATVEAIGKDRENTIQKYKFRGIDDMYNALNAHLSAAKIYFTSEVLTREREERKSNAGGNLIYTVLTIKWTIHAEDGSFVETSTVGEAMDSGDKSANKAMSAAYKYALMQVFCIPTDEPKDTEAESHDVAPKTPPAPASTGKTCPKCSAPMAVSKSRGKEYCSKLCWKTPEVQIPKLSPAAATMAPEGEKFEDYPIFTNVDYPGSST